jgi:hypothetical protein
MAACGGLHCAGCAGGAAVPLVPLAAFCGLAWIAEHLIEVIVVCGVSGALAVAASIALFRWADRRDARQGARWRLLHVREVPLIAAGRSGLEAQTGNAIAGSGTRVPLSGAAAGQPALGFRDLHIHLDGLPRAEQAAAIRQALNGRTGHS